jgi:hypothetical protein
MADPVLVAGFLQFLQFQPVGVKRTLKITI